MRLSLLNAAAQPAQRLPSVETKLPWPSLKVPVQNVQQHVWRRRISQFANFHFSMSIFGFLTEFVDGP